MTVFVPHYAMSGGTLIGLAADAIVMSRHAVLGPVDPHDYPITFEIAEKIGFKVQSDMPPEILQLMSLYPQSVRRHPSVEYIPTRRRADGEAAREGAR